MNFREKRDIKRGIDKAKFVRLDTVDDVKKRPGEQRILKVTKTISNQETELHYHKLAKDDGTFVKSIAGIDVDTDTSGNPFLYIMIGNKKMKINLEEI